MHIRISKYPRHLFLGFAGGGVFNLKIMLLRKINKGIYEALDAFENNYVVQDTRIAEAKNLPDDCETSEGHWGVWFENLYQFSENENERMHLDEPYVFINNGRTLSDCLYAVSLLEEAQEVTHRD